MRSETDHQSPPVDKVDFSSIKTEIAFFMEKGFQVSFGYLGGLIALGAAANADLAAGLARSLDVSKSVVGCFVLLLLNCVYLTVASGALFAVVKRGMFILKTEADRSHLQSVEKQWESFVRRSDHSPFGGGAFGALAWNLDNLYMTPVFVLIAFGSVGAAVFGVAEMDTHRDRVLMVSGMVLQLIPVISLLTVAKMTRACDKILAEPQEETTPQPAGAGVTDAR